VQNAAPGQSRSFEESTVTVKKIFTVQHNTWQQNYTFLKLNKLDKIILKVFFCSDFESIYNFFVENRILK